IANVNTIGYKSVDTRFVTQHAASENPFRFYSAKAWDRTYIALGGVIQSTGRSNDLALNGAGFFIVSPDFNTVDQNNILFTRAGAFGGSLAPSGNTEDGAWLTNPEGLFVLGWNFDRQSMTFSGSLGPIRIDGFESSSGLGTTRLSLIANVNGDVYDDNTRVLTTAVFSPDGVSRTLRFNFTRDEFANHWLVDIIAPDGTVTSPGQMEWRFSEDGRLISPASFNISLDWGEGGSTTIEFDPTQITQFAGETTIRHATQNGYAFGLLTGTMWDRQGVLHATFSNGQSIPVAKLAIGNVVSTSGLLPVSNTMFQITQAAGEISIIDLTDGTFGGTTVLDQSLESSNVNLEEQFAKMIVTQRAYTGNSNVFKVGNEMWQTAINLKV
ncbi:MAG: flagellar hook-basal body complex protein, partial [Alphaproteobacteria bacterium]|nr:flagellar hook-basal body complex protein [Alphaproteobacteria bacterium]